jgi:dienelactone hydrolase
MKDAGAARTIIAAILAGLLVAAAAPYLHATMLMVRVSGIGGWAGRIAAWDAQGITETPEEIPTRYGPVHARLFRPAGRVSRSALLVSGVHPAGVEESRLRGLARELAEAGVGVVTPEIRDLTHYRITGRATDTIEDAAVWLAARADLAPDHRVGMMGISFSGGLAIVAAGRPALRDRVAYVFSFGGQGNLPRVLKYLCTGVQPASAPGAPAGAALPPHDYGVAVVLVGVVDRVVPPEQVELLRRGVETFLSASALAGVDPPRAEKTFASARALAAGMPEPAATLMRYVNERDVARLGPRLLPYIGTLGDDPSLSPDQSPAPAAPVYLLHGLDDNVIPTVETPLLAAHLRKYGKVRMLLTEVVAHAGVNPRARLTDGWPLVLFWTDLLSN